MEKALTLLNTLLLKADYVLKDITAFNCLLYSIERLLRNGFSDEVILNHLTNCNLATVTPKTLPDAFWKDSLLNPNAFYFHRILQLTAPPKKFCLRTQTFNTSEPPFLEMRIQFTPADFLNYLYTRFQTPYIMRQEKRDIGTLFHLLEKYNTLYIEKTKVESIDYILFLIDFAKQTGTPTAYLTLLECENQYNAKALECFIYQVTQIITSHHNQCKYKGGEKCGI